MLLSDQEIKAKDGAGALSSRRHNEIFLSQPLRVSSTKRPGPAAGQASLCDLWFSLSGVMIALTISWRHAIRARLCLRADPRRRSCLLTTAGSGFFGFNGRKSRLQALVSPPQRNGLTSSPQSSGGDFCACHAAPF